MLIDATTSLPDGLRVRLRLPQPGDRAGLHALHERLGVQVDELVLARMLRFDPSRRAVACAIMHVDGVLRPVGYGAIDLGAHAPDLLVSDEAAAPGVAALLDDALRERARRRAA